MDGKKQELDDIEKTISEAKEKVKALAADKKALSAELKGLSSDNAISEAKGNLADLEKAISELGSKIKGLSAKKKVLETELKTTPERKICVIIKERGIIHKGVFYANYEKYGENAKETDGEYLVKGGFAKWA